MTEYIEFTAERVARTDVADPTTLTAHLGDTDDTSRTFESEDGYMAWMVDLLGDYGTGTSGST